MCIQKAGSFHCSMNGIRDTLHNNPSPNICADCEINKKKNKQK